MKLKYALALVLSCILCLPGALPALPAEAIEVQNVMSVTSLAKSLNGSVGSYFSAHFNVSGGVAPYTWEVGGLPSGLYRSLLPSATTQCAYPADDALAANISAGCPPPYVSGEDLIVSGTPTVAGVFPVTFRVIDRIGNEIVSAYTFTISGVLANPGVLSIQNDGKYASAQVGKYFLTTFTAVGGNRPYTWKVSGQLPPGMGRSFADFNCIKAPCIPPVDLRDSLYVSGVPTTSGSYTYTIAITDNGGKSISQSFTTVVSGDQVSKGITVSSPKAGDVWTLGGQYTITWVNTTGSNKSPNITITVNAPRLACQDQVPACLVKEAAPYVIASNITDTGSYTWTVPNNLPEIYQGTKHITVAATEGSLMGKSGQFTIGKQNNPSGNIIVTSPEAGSVWSVGKTYAIAWSGNNDTPVRLWLQPQYRCDAGAVCPAAIPRALLLAENVSGNTYTWTVPVSIENQKLDGSYYISIETLAYGSTGTVLWGQSGTFAIAAGSPGARLAPASVLRTPNKAVHLVLDNNAYYTFRTWEEFLSKGYVFQHIRAVGQGALDGMTQTTFFERPSGTTFKYPNDRTVYYLTTTKCKQAYTSFGVFQAWRLRLVDIVLMQPSEEFPTCSDAKVRLPDRVAIKVGGKTVYLYENGKFRPIASPAAYKRVGSPEVFIIGDADFAAYAKGDILE